MFTFPKVALICLLCFSCSLAMADTDVVVFANGDRLTGELKSLDRGLMRFNTDATGTISIEWDKVAYISSEQNIQVETDEGLRFLGSLAWPADAGWVTVDTTSGAFELESRRVVKMEPIEDTLSGRFDGQLLFGYNFTKASSVEQLTFGLDLDYRTELRIYSLDLDASASDSQDSEASQRSNLNFTYRRLRPNRWLISGVARLASNDELGLKLRSSIGGGIGRFIRQTNSTNLILEGGVTLNQEQSTGDTSSEESWEFYSGLSWDWFRYDLPELDLSADLQVFPSLTESGRVRTELDITFRWELFNDLFWSTTYYNSYDNRPSDPEASKSDYGINTSLGWNF